MKNFEMGGLLDVYGALLPERQRRMAEDYYNYDLSLAEIAENCGITRQGVCDALKSAERALLKYERLLRLAEIKEGVASAVLASGQEKQSILEKLNSI